MNILVINTGSSSIKYSMFAMDSSEVVAVGVAERIGEKTGRLTHSYRANGRMEKTVEERSIADHQEGLHRIAELLTHRTMGVVRDHDEIEAVGHRVVHGGEAFQAPTIIDASVIDTIRDNISLAPLHNPANLTGIEIARSEFPGAQHVAVFDTAFHQTIPAHAFLYGLPMEFYEKHHVRRYGFHGTSHAYVTARAAEFLGRPLGELNTISIHLGNGASIAAVKNGACVDTSMGMTPLEGLMMGTRSGDIDPAIPFYLAHNLKMPFEEIDRLLNKESGLKGLCGTNDMREVIGRKEAGDRRAALALAVYVYRIKKYIGAYVAALGGLDLLIFTAGIGENSPEIRAESCRGLEVLGVVIDGDRNTRATEDVCRISAEESRVAVLVVPTNEELRIALETQTVVENEDAAVG